MDEDELFALLEVEMSVMPCESTVHDTSALHAGTGEWYVTYTCPRCMHPTSTMLYCDRYNSYLPSIIQIAGNSVVSCNKCGSQFLYMETIFSSEKRRV